MPYPSHGVLGTASPPSLEQTLGGGSITPTHGSGYPGPFPEGGGDVTSSLQANSQVRLPKSHSKTGTVL